MIIVLVLRRSVQSNMSAKDFGCYAVYARIVTIYKVSDSMGYLSGEVRICTV